MKAKQTETTITLCYPLGLEKTLLSLLCSMSFCTSQFLLLTLY